MGIKDKLLETRSAIYDVFRIGSPSAAPVAMNYNPASWTGYRMLNSWSNIINGFQGTVLGDSYVRSVVHCIASYACKLQAQHIVQTGNGRYDIINDRVTYLLNKRPNIYMPASVFNYKILAQLLTTNNAFVYPQHDDAGNLIALWPISFDNARAVENKETGQMAIVFSLMGSQILVPYEYMIHLRNQFCSNDLNGDDQSEALQNIVNQSAILKQARENILKANGTAQFILKAQGALKQADLDKAVQSFVESYGMKNRIASIDNKLDVQAVSSQCVGVNNEDIVQGKKDILTYFGISESMLSGDYDEQQLEAFLVSKIEPFAVQLGQELEYKLLSDAKISRGHEIIYTVNALQCASIQTRVDMCERLVTIGLMSCNEGRKIIGLQMRDEPEADELRVSLNTVNLKTAKDYQLGRAGVKQIEGGNKDDGNDTEKEV